MITIKCVLKSQKTKFICNRYVRLSHVDKDVPTNPVQSPYVGNANYSCSTNLWVEIKQNPLKKSDFFGTPHMREKSKKALDGTSIVIKGSY